MRLACSKDFQHGPIYTKYPLSEEVYDRRAKLFRYFPEPILVAGCGFGGLVDALQRLRKQAWGIDASQYAIDNATSRRAFKFDILNLSTWTLGQMETVVTEDLIPCLTDDEVLVAARNCQALAPIVIHMVTESGQADLSYRSCVEVMRITNQLTVSLEGM